MKYSRKNVYATYESVYCGMVFGMESTLRVSRMCTFLSALAVLSIHNSDTHAIAYSHISMHEECYSRLG